MSNRMIHNVEIDDDCGAETLYGITFAIGVTPHVVWFGQSEMECLIEVLESVAAEGTAELLAEVLARVEPS